MTQSTLRKELDETRVKLKSVQQTNTTLDGRLFKAHEDLEYVRKNFHVAKEAERRLQEALQQDRKFYEAKIKTFEKQQSEMRSAFKKQMLLLENLKRQNARLEQAKLIQLAEKDFAQILDWNCGDRK